MEKGGAPKATQHAGPRDLAAGARVFILTLRVFRGQSIPACSPSGPRSSTGAGCSCLARAQGPALVVFLSRVLSAILEPGAFLPTHFPRSLTMSQVWESSCS